MRKTFKPITAADESSIDSDDISFDDFDDLQDTVDDASDTIDDLQDSLDAIDDYPDDTILDIQNNIDGHYIAECDRCHEIFITAIVESNSDIKNIEGECPCCHKDTKQTLKWIIRSIAEDR